MQLGDLDAHLHAQHGVEVRERLVEQEHLRLAHERPADGDALALAAGELRRPAVEQFLELQHARHFQRAPVLTSFGALATRRLKPMFWRTVMCG